MSERFQQFIKFLQENRHICRKETLISECVKRFNLTVDRKVYYCNFFAVRFCYSKSGSFSNTVLALSSLQKYDTIPFLVVIVKLNADNVVYLANSSFLKKISHSSKELSVNNIKGSFNGSDIVKKFRNLDNSPENFEELFAWHMGIDWDDNLLRLVEATSDIKSVANRFEPTSLQRNVVLESVERAKKFVLSDDYDKLNSILQQRCEQAKEAILVASHIENVKIRGCLIEAIISSDGEERQRLLTALMHLEQQLPTFDSRNGLGDFRYSFPQSETYTDIKTKVVYLKSNPKMFNIDKFLECMAEEKSVFLFFFIGIDEKGITSTALCSVFHPLLLDNILIQHHWAGRSTRGVAQLSGKAIEELLQCEKNKLRIIAEDSKDYLVNLLTI